MRKIGYIFIVILIAFFLYAPFDSENSKQDKPELDITFGKIDPAAILDSCRQKVADLRNSTPEKLEIYLLSRPEWTNTTAPESFDIIYNNQLELLKNGTIVWAAIVQANEDLFKGTKEQLPAAIVYSMDNSINSQPNKLDEISETVYHASGKSKDQQLKDFAAILTDESSIHLNLKIPEQLTDGIECYFSHIMIEPKFLPNRKLCKRIFPIITQPEKFDSVIILPDQLWDHRLVEFFE